MGQDCGGTLVRAQVISFAFVLLASTAALAACAPNNPPDAAQDEFINSDGTTGWVGFCTKIANRDLRIREAAIVVSSGDPKQDEKMRREVIGMRTPGPVAWTSDFWASLRVGLPKHQHFPLPDDSIAPLDCSAFNMKLCGLSDCRQAPRS